MVQDKFDTLTKETAQILLANARQRDHWINANMLDCEFIADPMCVKKFAETLKNEFGDKLEPEQITVGVLQNEDECIPAVNMVTKFRSLYLTEDSVYWSYTVYDTVVKTREDLSLSFKWLKILKNEYGTGYIQKMIANAQRKMETEIKSAQQEFSEYTKKFDDLDLKEDNKNVK